MTRLASSDTVFSGSIADLYDALLVPLIFAPYATTMAHHVAARAPRRVLEIAAGTGAVTRALASVLPQAAEIVATDLNRAMLDRAAAVGTTRPVEWHVADAMQLPFEDESFDVVVCQFAAMFFPDRATAFSEARRVLRPEGAYLFSVWDRIEDNEFADVVERAMQPLFPDDPPRFLSRTPHGYHDRAVIERDLADGGFTRAPAIETIAERSRAASARLVAAAYCEGTPLRNEIESRDPSALPRATDAATNAIARRFGADTVDGRIQAHLVTIER
jgi:SAM-dependent methyltransferase